MNFFIKLVTISIIIVSVGILKLKTRLVEVSDKDTCVNTLSCFGNNLCDDFIQNNIYLKFNSIYDVFNNFIGVKQVYFGQWNNKKVVIKKIVRDLPAESAFYICDDASLMLLLQEMLAINNFTLFQARNLVLTNAEPFLFQIFSSKKFSLVPKLYGFCGRLMVVENCGESLTNKKFNSWFERAYVSYQLLLAASNFTSDHPLFRLYLTDISSDNIVIDDNLLIKFVDLDNTILIRKTPKKSLHYTEHIGNEEYAFSKYEICGSEISDHNIYSVCRLLLSKQAPYPMMSGGLLKDPPNRILQEFGNLFNDIELCVVSSDFKNRFILSKQIVTSLKTILLKENILYDFKNK